MLNDISQISARRETVIYALDESHFSNRPYLVRGWFKKGERFRIQTPGKRESLTCFGGLNLKTRKFYWKKSAKSGSDAFLSFLSQLRQKDPGKQVVIILDNVSIHKSGKVKRYLKRHPDIHLFYLPTYSPEYNPVELFWKWIKPKAYGFLSFGGIQELMSGFGKLVRKYNCGKYYNPIKFNLKTYKKIL